MRKTILLSVMAIISLCLYSQNKNRYALLIGNNKYFSRDSLKNPVHDVELLAAKLKECGFTVIAKTNVTKTVFISTLEEFYKILDREPCIALFYFSGHGIQANNTNFLVPTDAKIFSSEDVQRESINVHKIMTILTDSKSITNIMILDACRNDPFPKVWDRKGLADPPENFPELFTAFATGPGKIANDGDGNNSPYVEALTKHLDKVETSIGDVFTDITNEVSSRYPDQVPNKRDNLRVNFYFKTNSQVIANTEKQSIENLKTNMSLVEGGTFDMGTSVGNTDEEPVHIVQLKSFYLSKWEVTQLQWKAVMGTVPSKTEKECQNCPVENVSWEDVDQFIKKLNEITGLRYRLPTEAEWEYAARGGKTGLNVNYSGSNKLDKFGWYYDNANGKKHISGNLNPNQLGLYDMSGNVSEWCSDWYGSSYYNKRAGQDPAGPGSGRHKVVRGGSWDDYNTSCRVFAREKYKPDERSKLVGFRLARSTE